METTKTCTKCKQTLPVGAFSKKDSCNDRIKSICKTCVAEASRAWHAANPEKASQKERAWRAENPEKVRVRSRAQRAKNPEKTRAQDRARRAANREKTRAQDRARYAANPEKARKQSLAWNAVNSEKVRDRKRAQVECLSDSYVRSMIGINAAQAPPEFVEAKRNHIKILRLLKEQEK